jgi:hypothetical protein
MFNARRSNLLWFLAATFGPYYITSLRFTQSERIRGFRFETSLTIVERNYRTQ